MRQHRRPRMRVSLRKRGYAHIAPLPIPEKLKYMGVGESASREEKQPELSTHTDHEQHNSHIAPELDNHPTDAGLLLPLRNRPPLWEGPSGKDEPLSPRYPRNRKKSLIIGIIIFVLVAVSIALGVLWQFQGISPLDLFSTLTQ